MDNVHVLHGHRPWIAWTSSMDCMDIVHGYELSLFSFVSAQILAKYSKSKPESPEVQKGMKKNNKFPNFLNSLCKMVVLVFKLEQMRQRV